MANANSGDLRALNQILPARLNDRRLALLPKIVDEWRQIDLPRHRSITSSRSAAASFKRLELIKTNSKRLSRALHAARQADDEFWISRELTSRDGMLSESHLNDCYTMLDELARAAGQAAENFRTKRGRPRNDLAALVLMDIVAIYEWITGQPATRRVGRETGQDEGPFWRFASRLWALAFDKGTEGLSSAMKTWAAAVKKKEKGTRSPLMANFDLRHPEWQIFRK